MACPKELRRAHRIVAEYPFGVINANDGFRVIRISTIEEKGLLCLGHMKHDTSREDPTLVADVLRETYDPETVHKHFFFQFVAFFKTLDVAIARIDAHEARYGWERKHIRQCREALTLAQRNLRAAEQSQRQTVWDKFDRWAAEAPYTI